MPASRILTRLALLSLLAGFVAGFALSSISAGIAIALVSFPAVALLIDTIERGGRIS
jgi:hypothetical protein